MADERLHRHALVVQFIGDVLKRTIDCPTVVAHQQALQAFLDELAPWVTPADLPPRRRQSFTLFDHLSCAPHGEDEDVWVALSPEGQAFFRAWLRQRGVDPFFCSS